MEGEETPAEEGSVVETEEIFVFDPEERAAILRSIGLPEGELADRLIFYCEMVADKAYKDLDYYFPLPSAKEARQRIYEILWHISAAIRLATFNSDMDMANKFWNVILFRRKGVILGTTWKRFCFALRMLVVAKKFLERVKINEYMFARGERNIEVFKNYATGNESLKTLSVVYCHVLRKKCGRSKSTIGPFVRFAHAVMLAIAGDLTPPVETINERWARLDFDPTTKHLDKKAIAEYCKRRGIESPR
jgi:hypothetical protein